MDDITTVTIDPARLAIGVFTKTLNEAKAANAVSHLKNWASDKPIVIQFDAKAGRYSNGKGYRRGLVVDESVLAELDAEIGRLNGA